MKMSALPLPKSSPLGFSLLELLTVIAVIGCLTAVAVPSIGAVTSAGTDAAQQSNAQSIVSVFGAGRAAADLPWVVTSRNACVADVIAGRTATSGSAFAGRVFTVPGIKGADLTGVYRYIGLDSNKNLFFDKTGSQSPR